MCAWKFKVLKKRALYIIWFCIMALLMQSLSTTLSRLGMNNMWVLHVYTVSEFVLLGLFYYHLLKLKPEKGKVNWPLIGLVGVALCIVAGSIFINSINGYNPFSRTLECIILCSLAIIFYVKEIRSLEELSADVYNREGFIFINTAVLILFSGQFFIYLLSGFIDSQLEYSRSGVIWIFNGILNVIFYSMLLVGIWKLASPKKNFSGSF